MAEFLNAYKRTSAYEGGYTDKPNMTYKGIDRKYWPNWEGWATIDAIQNAEPLHQGEFIDSTQLESMVRTFFKKEFWNKINGDKIDSQEVAEYLYDWYVNAGGNAIKGLQKALKIKNDGVFGSGTLDAVNKANEKVLLNQLYCARVNHYNLIAGINPDNKQYLQGWINRAKDLYKILST
jgi:lysozyme family protein